MLRSKGPLPARGTTRLATTARAFTLLEVALIVAIIGMMLLMIIGYLFAPTKPAKLPPIVPPKLIPPSNTEPMPAPKKATPIPAPAPSAGPVATPAPTAPAAPTATPAPTPLQTIDLSPQSAPVFR